MTTSTTDTNTTSSEQPGSDNSSHWLDQKTNDAASMEQATHVDQKTDNIDHKTSDQRIEDTTVVDQEASSLDQQINDTLTMDETVTKDQRIKDTTVVDQGTSSSIQQINDTPTLDQTDQKVKDAHTIDQKATHTEVFTDQNDAYDSSEVEVSPEEMTKLTLLTPYLIPSSDLTCITNSEGFGTTNVVKWYNTTDCSLQEFNLDFTKPEGRRKFGRYLSACATLARLRHPNLQQLLGFVSQEGDSTKPSASVVTELLDLTLTKLLANHKCNELKTSTHVSICYDVAKAVNYLHLSKLSHLLIRSDCVLLTRDYHAKLSDIASSLLYQSGLNNEVKMINANYLPPDGMLPGANDAKIDTFSIGVLFLQTITHVTPDPVAINETHRTEIECRQDHIDLVHSSHPLLTLIIACLSNKPDDRPTDEEICSVLEASLTMQD